MPILSLPKTRAATLARPDDFSPLDLTWKLLLDGNELVGADGAAIASWRDISGNDYHAAQATGSKQPVIKTDANALNGHKWAAFDGTDDALATPAVDLSGDSVATIYVVVKNSAATATIAESSPNYATNNGAFACFYEGSTVSASVRANSINASIKHGGNPGAGWIVYVNRIDTSIRKGKAFPLINGRARTGTIVANQSGAVGDLVGYAIHIGARNGASFPLNGGIAWMGVAAEYHSGATTRKILDYLSHRYGLVTAPAGVVVFDGESNTDANDVSALMKPWGHILLDRFTNDYDAANFGVGGQGFGTTAMSGTMAFDAATQVDSWADPRANGVNALVVLGGINDLHTPTTGSQPWNNTTKEDTLQRIKDYFAARGNAGWTRVMCTLMANNQPTWDSTAQADYMATERPFINSWLINDAVNEGYLEAVVDLTTNANLEDYTNTTYFHTDESHLTATGHTEVADEIEPVLATLGIT